MKSDPKTGGLCYECKHRGDIPGSRHSRCCAPYVGTGHDPVGEVFALLGKRMGMLPIPAEKPFYVEFSQHGRECGWANWPFNFDPVWLIECNGFEPSSTAETSHEQCN